MACDNRRVETLLASLKYTKEMNHRGKFQHYNFDKLDSWLAALLATYNCKDRQAESGTAGQFSNASQVRSSTHSGKERERESDTERDGERRGEIFLLRS